MDGKTTSEQRLLELVEEGLSSPIEPDGPEFWQKRRETLRRVIAKKRDIERAKLSSR
jgi:hypothetical protein